MREEEEETPSEGGKKEAAVKKRGARVQYFFLLPPDSKVTRERLTRISFPPPKKNAWETDGEEFGEIGGGKN